MKKKIIVLILVVMLVCLVIFGGCDIENTGTTDSGKPAVNLDRRYPYAYVKIGEEWVHLEISTYNVHNGVEFELVLTDGTKIWVHGLNCILYDGDLPIQGVNND